MEEQLIKLKSFVEKLENKDFGIYFFVLDTKGNPTAGVANIYELVKLLTEAGYNATILTEKNDYKLKGDENGMGIEDWLGPEYTKLPHMSIESQQLNIASTDFLVIPEIFANIMDQAKGFPCRKIVLCQSYDYLLELLPIGKKWNIDYGFYDVITTSQNQARYVQSLFPSISTHVVPVSIPNYFNPAHSRFQKPKMPVVAISTRNQGDAAKIAKSFYLQFPIYKWITFKDMRGLTRPQFAEELNKCCLAVWIDPTSGFGTFPIEAIKTGTPVIGVIPNLVPEWMETEAEDGTKTIASNGVWTNTTVNIPELIATYLKVWLEDAVPTDIIENMKLTADKYTTQGQKETLENVFSTLVSNRVTEFNNMITSLETKADLKD